MLKNNKLKNFFGKSWLKKLAAAVGTAGLAIFLTGIFSFSSLLAKDFVYVDDDASGSMDGSKDHPFNKIQDAINLASDKKKDVFIKEGVYRENLRLWEKIELVGEKRGKVVIIAKDKDEPVVTMYDGSEIHKLTLLKGKYGVRVKGGSAAEISKCDIIQNKEDGIKAHAAKVKEKYQLEIYDSYISQNGRNGIYSERRKIVVEDTLVEDNDKDGIEAGRGSQVYIKQSRFKNNGGDGGKFYIDQSNITIKESTFRDNSREGLEIRRGQRGSVYLEFVKFYDNKRWGIARVEKAPFSDADWQASFSFQNLTFSENDRGDLSHFIIVY